MPFCFSGVDDAESECGLDNGVTWDFIITNDNQADQLEADLQKLITFIEKHS